ncbi:MAG: transposase, partial [Planctomycetaceae bacterium]|nr:transposase [Planctomycetaceae bacterium]
NPPLTDEQKENNRKKSKIRCRVEHIFGAMKMRRGNEIMRCIGKTRAVFQIGMRNVVYNRRR